MNYNKKNQRYTVTGRFQIFEGKENVDYCRVVFHDTGYIDNIRAELVKSNDFEDSSLVEEIFAEPSLVTADFQPDLPLKPEHTDDSTEDALTPEKIIATNPKGDDIEVEDLVAFCEENKLDFDAVQTVIEGKQKTHRKWRFSKA